MITFGSDVADLILQRTLGENTLGLNNSINRMTTGYKVNQAKDNAAGYSIITDLSKKISSMLQDIASQDYAENAELATQALVAGTLAFGTLFNLLLSKALKAMKVKSEAKISAISQIAAVTIPVIFSIASAQIQKQASRVGRFKIKQDLMNNPSKLVYVSDENIADLKDVNVIQDRKEGLFKFLTHAWKNNKEYNQYKKTTAKQEEKFYKAIETLELTPEQIKDAQTLQRNTFKTFNKVDEKSQKYSESIEALGLYSG